MKKLILILLMILTLAFTACAGKTPVIVYADYLEDEYLPDTSGMEIMEIVSLSENYDLFIRDASQYSAFVVFSSDTKVKDFEFYTIAIPEGDKVEYNCEKTVLHYDDISADKSLVIQMEIPETVPWYGISYKDENGDIVKYAIHMSGYDGSVVLEKFE